MSKEMREQIDSVKNWKQFLNEQSSLDNVKLNNNLHKWFGNSKVVDKNGNPRIC